MSKMAKDTWEHSAGDHRIEDLAATDPVISENLSRLALRYISSKGLSDEFADVLEQYSADLNVKNPEEEFSM